MIDGGEVNNYSTENRAVIVEVRGLAAAWARVVPWAVLGKA